MMRQRRLPDSSTMPVVEVAVCVSASRPDCQPAGMCSASIASSSSNASGGAGLGEQPRRHRFDARPGDHDVGDRWRPTARAADPRDARRSRGRAPERGRRCANRDAPRPAARTPAREPLSRSVGLADAEVGHQLGLVGQEVAVLELAVDHHAAQRAPRRARRSSASEPPYRADTDSGPIIGASGVLRANRQLPDICWPSYHAIQLSKPCGTLNSGDRRTVDGRRQVYQPVG